VLYKRFYEPRTMVLVSRAPVPSDVKKWLEGEGIHVIDNVGFNVEALAPIADVLEEEARREDAGVDFVELTPRAKELLRTVVLMAREKGLEDAPPRLIERALESLASLMAGARERKQSE
jgi:hypothetical protein